MGFEEQIKWLEDKLAKESPSSPDAYVLEQIIKDYKKAEERSITLSWYESPERMGR